MNYQIIIESLNISQRKGEVKRPTIIFEIDSFGIVGDAHRGNWHRQVSFLDVGKIDHFAKNNHLSLSNGDFGENINYRVIAEEVSEAFAFDVGDKIIFQLNDNFLHLIITQIGKDCHNHACPIKQQTGACIMPTEGLFARVDQISSPQSLYQLSPGMVGIVKKA